MIAATKPNVKSAPPQPGRLSNKEKMGLFSFGCVGLIVGVAFSPVVVSGR